jgi:hypothetical protein
MSTTENQTMQILKLLQCNCVNNNASVDLQHYVDLIESVYKHKNQELKAPTFGVIE